MAESFFEHMHHAFNGTTSTDILVVIAMACIALVALVLAFIYFVTITLASLPRPSLTSEEKYFTAEHGISKAYDLPCWASHWSKNHCAKKLTANETIEPAEVHITVVIPAYNEEERLKPMLDEAIPYLDKHYGRAPLEQSPLKNQTNHVSQVNLNGPDTTRQRSHKPNGSTAKGGYEILIVDDGSKDDTVNLALRIAASHGLGDTFRVIKLKHNRGKGGAVTHGMRHARGEYVLFADADGASEFSDVAKLIKACKDIEDDYGRGIAIGSRAHMVGQDAVIQRSALRNLLMHCFHYLLWFLTPTATSRIKDTQCGFKLFSRPSLPHIIPYMTAEGWIFDVEMLMLAESAPPIEKGSGGIKVAEVAIGWHEIGGSKLNVIKDSLAMAYGLALLRSAWYFGIYKRR